MTDTRTPTIRVMGDKIEGLDEALADVRTRAFAEGTAAGAAEGYARGRADAAAIVGSEHAAGRHELAAELAADPGITPDRATALLAKTPKAAAATLPALMAGRIPDIGPAAQPSDGTVDRAARAAELSDLTKRVAARR